MGLTPDEAAQLAALQAKAAQPDPEPPPADPAEVAAEVAAEVGAATADAVADTAEAVADAVADAEPDVVIEAPDPVAVAEADAIRIAAEADAQVAVIDAEAGATIAVIDAQADAERVAEPEPLDILDEVLGPVEDIIPDTRPAPAHRWFRPFGQGRS